MAVVGSPFCEHKKLRTSCGICRPATLHVDATLRAVPYVPQEDREKASEKRERRAVAAEERGEPAPSRAAGPRGPGKPLLPSRKTKRRDITAAEADAVRPWWVKK